MRKKKKKAWYIFTFVADEMRDRRFVYNDLSIFILSSLHQTHSKQYVSKTRLSLNILFLFQFINFVTIQIAFFDQIQQ